MRSIRRLAVSTVIAAGVVAMATPAGAHVTVNPREQTKGGFAKLTFRVPTERDDASTTKVEVQFPEDAVIQSVGVRPPAPGWRYTIEKRTLDEPIVREGRDPITEVVSRTDGRTTRRTVTC